MVDLGLRTLKSGFLHETSHAMSDRCESHEATLFWTTVRTATTDLRLKRMKKLLIVLTFLLTMPAFADDLEEYVKLLKTDLNAQAKEIVTKGMQTFTDEEAKRFWPIYDSYMAERGKFLEARVALIKAYADDYDKMTDAKAQELLNRRFEQLKLRDKLDEKYRPQFATALSPRRLVRFYQIQHELEVLMELRAVSQIPKMKWW